MILLYKDEWVEIREENNEFSSKWIQSGQPNESYVESKLVEVVGNKHPGTWPIKSTKEKLPNINNLLVKKEIDGYFTARWVQ